MIRPLSGVTLIEAMSDQCPLALRLAAAMAGRVAADLGARVIKLEPPGGDPVRTLPPLAGAQGAIFAFLNAGKQSVAVDAIANSNAAVARLLKRADAVLLDEACDRVLGERNGPPIRTVLSMLKSGVDTGPQTEFTVMALGGLLDIVGEPERQPLRLGGHQLAYATGLAAYSGLAGALVRRPDPEVVHVSMLDVAIWLNWKSAASVACLDEVSSRAGRGAAWPVVRCADGWIALVYQNSDWAALCNLVNDPRLGDARFANAQDRTTNARELVDIVEASFLKYTRAELKQRALERRLPLGPVWEIAELKADPQVLARDFLTSMKLGEAQMTTPRLPLLWNGNAFPVGTVPAVGSHADILEPAS